MATPTPAATPVAGTQAIPSTPHQEHAPEAASTSTSQATPGTQGSSCPPASPSTSCHVTLVPATQTETPTAANLTPTATQGYYGL